MAKRIEQPTLFAMVDDRRELGARSGAERYREPSLLDAIREAPARVYEGAAASVVGGAALTGEALRATMVYRVVAYGAAPTTRGFDKITGTVERRRATMAEAIAWGRAHGGAFNVYRWDGEAWLWCSNNDSADAAEQSAKVARAVETAAAYEAHEAEGAAEREALLSVPLPVRVQRASSSDNTFWLLVPADDHKSGERQVGAVVKDGTNDKPWRGDQIRHGMPVARRLFADLGGALRWAAETKEEGAR